MTEVNFTAYLDSLQAFSAGLGEPDWMLTLRKNMLEKLATIDMPFFERVKLSRWALTDVTEPMIDMLPADFQFGLDEIGTDTPAIFQYGQQTVMEQMPQALVEQGVIFTDIFTAMREHSDLVKDAYMQYAVKADEDKLTAFHAAFMNSGMFLYVPKNVKVTEPFEAVFYQNSEIKQNFIKHVLILADEYSEFNYVERFYTKGNEENTANIIVEVVAKTGAKVKFSSVDRLGENNTIYFNRRGHLLKDAHIDWAMGVMNDGDMIADFDSDLVGEGSHAEVKIVAVSTGKQIQAIDTRVTNYGRHSIGHILQHGVILDKSTLTFNGIGHIIKGAVGADAQQESRVLMLSDKARGDANPILLIDENDVTAGHAASVGRVDPEEMFYLMSRGLSPETAKRLVIRGFLGSVIAAIPLKEVRNELVEVIDGKLDNESN